jgi:pSer/pThr/pTyr-binding forkhead associated (FHA) protein
MLEDLGSANGTFLNEEKISGAARLQSGDVIRVGPFEMRFVVEEISQAAPLPMLSPALAPVVPAQDRAGFESDQTPAGNAPLPGAGDSTAVPPPPGARVSPLDQTEGRVAARRDDALLCLSLGAESLVVPVGDALPLAHNVSLGEMAVGGEAASVVRRPDGYWVEPSATGEAVFHNGKPVTSPTPLRSGDLLQVGPLQLEFTCP